jgi:CBS domain-containing protein
MARISELLGGRELFSVNERDTVAEAARYMAELHVGAILVLDGENLRGVFSERDLMERVVVERRAPDRTTVGSVMSTQVVSIQESASLEEAMEAMLKQGCRHLPVLRGSRVTGFLSMRDLMHYEIARKTEEIAHMRAYIYGA